MDYELSAEQAYKAFETASFPSGQFITEPVNFHGFVMNNQIFKKLPKTKVMRLVGRIRVVLSSEPWYLIPCSY